ncbi:MAG: 1-acyl-sn-glycerol-3-phosphate acyltransferase, partial [Firmicutes bacterium]|nr:1-acyl-sn-glycerol-3-phosphate acyltransferase [Bacillota bacterium]
MKEKNKKSESWIKKRHKVIQRILVPFVSLFCRVKYGVKVEEFKDQSDRPFLILMNHQTVADQFFLGMAFKSKCPIYFIATEDIFS